MVGKRRCVVPEMFSSAATFVIALLQLINTEATAAAVVFSAGTNPGYPCIRIPSALAIPSTNIVLAFAECRKWGGDQCFVANVPNATRAQQFNRSICMKRSTDGGASFGALQENITHRYSANPSAVVLPNNKIKLYFNDALDKTLFSILSNDLGQTWEKSTALLDHATGNILTGINGPGNSVVASSSANNVTTTIHIAVYDANRQNQTMFSSVKVLRSINHGRTWINVSPVSSPGIHMFQHLGEPSLTLLKNGILLLDARCPDGRGYYPGPASPCSCNCRGVSISKNNGMTWSSTMFDNTTVVDPDCQGAVLGLRNGSFVFSNPNSPTERIDLAVRLGNDVNGGGRVAWSKNVVSLANERTSAGYSSLFESDNGSVGVLWETEGNGVKCKGEGCSIVLSFI